MYSKRFLPFFIAVLSFLSSQMFLADPAAIYAAFAIIDIVLAAAVWRMTKDSLIDKKWWNYLILPVIFSNSLIAYSTLIPSKGSLVFPEILFALDAVFLYYYMRSVYYHLVLPTAERRASLENISSFGNFAAFFFTASSIYGVESFLNLPVWPLMLVLLSAGACLTYQIIWASRISQTAAIVYILVACLILSEIAWAMFYLPFDFNVSGAILSIDYYVLIGLLRTYLHGNLDKRMVKLYLGFGMFSILVILITARWL